MSFQPLPRPGTSRAGDAAAVFCRKTKGRLGTAVIFGKKQLGNQMVKGC